jgi:maltose O-acetyltransferase
MGCPRYRDRKGGAVVHRLTRIGANSSILPGVEIGEGLFGAGSVVTHHVPAGAVVAGNPARARLTRDACGDVPPRYRPPSPRG